MQKSVISTYVLQLVAQSELKTFLTKTSHWSIAIWLEKLIGKRPKAVKSDTPITFEMIDWT